MKIVQIVPGSGGTFYCQNCMRDNDVIKYLRAKGNDVLMVPMYLPLNVETHSLMGDTPVFYGAINLYLEELMPWFKKAPKWLHRFFDSEKMLQFAAKKAGSTKADGLEDMTISMLMGEDGRQAEELEKLVHFLKTDLKPDVVHLSNALLLGLAHRIKNDVGAAVVCSLQDENEWVDPMRPQYQQQVWDLMAEKAVDADAFITASSYFADRSAQQLNIPMEKIHTVFGGVDLDGYEISPLPTDEPVIGYLCRMSDYFGMGIITDAFIKLKKESRFKNAKLYLTGGYTADDKPSIKNLHKKIKKHKLENDIVIFEEFDKKHRINFLKSLTLLSVPVPGGEAFGAYMVEALAAGVPIVQPNLGGYPEFIERTGGGVIYEPNDAATLANEFAKLLENPDRLKEMGEKGRHVVLQHYSMENMASQMIDVYEKITQ